MKSLYPLLIIALFFSIDLVAQPIVNLGQDTIACGDSIVLDAGTHTGATTYLWNSGATTQTLAVYASDTVWVEVTDITGTSRDTIVIQLSPLPNLVLPTTDTNICLGLASFHAVSNAAYIEWYDSATAGNLIGTGDTLDFNVTTSDTLWVEGYTPIIDTIGLPDILGTVSGSNYYGAPAPRGIEFKVNLSTNLRAVSIFTDGALTATVEIRLGGALVNSWTGIDINGAGVHRIELNQELAASATNYTITIIRTAGSGQIYLDVLPNASFWSTLSNDFITLIQGIPSSSVNYQRFYRWEVEVGRCTSPRQALAINALVSPIIELPNDTALCADSFTIAANIANATSFVWSNGSSTNPTTIFNTDTLILQANNGGLCVVEDTIIAELFSIPNPNLPTTDTSLCEGLASFVVNGNADVFYWYDSSTAGNLIATGDTIHFNVTANDTIWVEGYNAITNTIGLLDTLGIVAGSNYYGAPAPRGIEFRVDMATNLRAVSIFTDGPLTATIEIRLGGALVNSWTGIDINAAGEHRIELNQALAASATNYTITITRTAGTGQIYLDVLPNASFWSTLGNDFITFIQGVPASSLNYQRFYRWEIEVANCTSPRQFIAINALPTPTIVLPNDTVICADSFVLAANIVDATSFVWSNGSSTNPTTIFNTDTLILQANNSGLCFAEDTFSVKISPIPTLNLPTTDTSLCEGLASFSVSGNADFIYWYDSSTAGNLIAIGDTIDFNVTTSDTLWVEGYNPITNTIGLLDTLGIVAGSNYYGAPAPRGIEFRVDMATNLRAVSIFTNGPLTADIEIRLGGTLVNSWTGIDINAAGEHRIELNQTLAASATNYTITILQTAGTGEIYLDVLPNASVWSTLGNDFITFIQGVPASALNYQRFYRWEVEVENCTSPRQFIAINALATPSISLPNDTALCADSFAITANIIDATSFVWSNGSTTNPTTIFSSDTLILQADNAGLCFAEDTFSVKISPIPTLSLPTVDTNLCTGLASFTVSGNADYFYWYDSNTTGNLLATGDTIDFNVTTSDTLWVEGYNAITNTVGLLDTLGVVAGSGYYGAPAPRGIEFRVDMTTNLRAVSIFTNGPLTADIEIRLGGTLVNSWTGIDINAAGVHRIELNQALAASATNYTITILQTAGTGEIYLDVLPNASVWSTLGNDFITFIQGVPASALNYQRFYRWEVEVENCTSPRQFIAINALATPSISLPNDTIICGDSLVVAATINNATSFVWSNGSTTNPTTIFSSDTLILQADNAGLCFVEDTTVARINPLPTLVLATTDTSLCTGVASFTASGNADFFYWYDSSTAGNLLNTGDTIDFSVTTSDTLWVEGYNSITNTIGLLDTLGLVGSGYYGAPAPRGIEFRVDMATTLRAVSIFTNGPLTADIEIRLGGTLVNSWTDIDINAAGVHRIPLNQILAANATNYTITITKTAGTGEIYLDVLPNTAYWSTLGNDFITFVQGIPGASLNYQRFYRWEVEVENCTSPRQAIAINALPTPSISLVADTLICESFFVLDASYPNANYSWSTGATTATITATTTDTFDVVVSIGSCIDTDTAILYFGTPSFISNISPDTTSCAGLISRTVSANAEVFIWYDSSSNGNVLGYGNTFISNLTDTTTLWAEAVNYSPKINVVGQVDTNASSGNSGFVSTINPSSLGLEFVVTEPVELQSVYMYVANAPFFGEVQLWDASNNIINTIPVGFTGAGKNKVNLGFDILPGTYRLILTNVNGIDVYAERGYNFSTQPISIPALRITNSYPISGSYNCFYEWEVRTVGCPSTRQATTVNILPTPVLNIPFDTVICGSSLVLDASAANANNYLWSTGSTSPNITVSNSDTVWVEASTGICSDRDTTVITITQPPSSVIVPNDTVVCAGALTLKASGNAYSYLWYDNATSSAPIAVGDSINYNLTDSTTLWVEGVGFLPNSGYVGASSYNPQGVYANPTTGLYPDRGLAFNVINPLVINTVNMLIDSTISGTIILRNSFGAVLASKAITLSTPGEHTISLDWAVNPGNGYEITLENLTGGNLWSRYPFGFPIVHPDLVITNGLPNRGGIRDVYAYFFKWKISTPSCATSRFPIKVDVPPSPVLILPSDTAVCNGGLIDLQATDINPAYTYNWSTAQTTNNISTVSSGYYAVTVTNNGECPVTKDIFVQMLSTPNTPSIADTAICNSQTIALLENPNDGILLWYDANNTPIYLSAPYPSYVGDTSEFIIQSTAHAVTRIGQQTYSTPNDLGAYQGFVIPNTFDVHELAVLDSIAVYTNKSNSTFQILLQDTLDNILATKTVTVANAFEKTFLPLNFVIPPGNSYKLSFSNFGSTKFLVDPSTQYPMSSSANIATLTGTSFVGISLNCFFDWHFSYAYPTCRSGLDSFMVQISMPVDLQDSVYTCDSLVLDLQHPNISSYQWSTGASTPSITVNNSGNYTVTISDGNLCTTVDSIKVEKPMPIGLPTNGVICKLTLLTNYSTPSSSFIWSTGETTDVINIPALGTYLVTVTTPSGCVLSESTTITQLENPPSINLGGTQVACTQDTLDAGFGNLGLTYLWNTGHTGQTLVVLQPNVYSVTATTPNGCTTTDFAYVDLDADPIANFGTITSGSVAAVSDSSIITTPSDTDYVWDWGDNTSQWVGPNPPAHLYTKDTCYTISLYLTNSCGTDTATRVVGINVPDSTCLPITTVNIPSIAQDWDFDIIPNPNTGKFSLDIEAATALLSLEIYDISGRVVYDAKQLNPNNLWTVDLNGLPSGVYFVRLISPKNSKAKRMLIHKE